MSPSRNSWLATLVVCVVLARTARSSLSGHSGVVLHVDKYGHLSGHSSHYDYRFYPEKYHLPLPVLHHNSIGHHHHHHIDDAAAMHEAFQLIEDDEYHASKPFYYYVHHDDHYDHHYH